MTPEQVQGYFTRRDGQYLFARWARPIVPVLFGVDAASLAIFKGAIGAVVALANHKMAEFDTELGANLMVFFCKDWAELRDVPNLEKLVPGLADLCDKLQMTDANQYRMFRFDRDGAIRAAFVFLRIDAHLAAVPAEVLALSQAVQIILLWSDCAFEAAPPLVNTDAGEALRPEIGALIRAGYDPVLPDMADNPAHGLRLFARIAAVV